MVNKTNVGYYRDGIILGDVDSAAFWADRSKDWAISEEIVDDLLSPDHSSKYYARESKKVYDGVAAEGNYQVSRIVEQGDIEVATLISEGDTQEARSRAEADKSAASAVDSAASAVIADTEADRAEAIAADLDDALRNAGYFYVSLLSYPVPLDQAIPYTWFCLDTGDIGDGIIWEVGNMLEYVPDEDPLIFGTYYRVAGELVSSSPPTPQPITILDDLTMLEGKRILFDTATDQLEMLRLNASGSAILGQHDSTGNKMGRINLAAAEVFIVNNLDSGDVPGSSEKISTETFANAADAQILVSANSYAETYTDTALLYSELLLGEPI